MRKVKVLIAGFVIFLAMSTDFAGLIQGGLSGQSAKEATDYVTIATFQKNVTKIATAVKNISSGEKKEEKTPQEYADLVAEQTTKTVENAILQQENKKTKQAEKMSVKAE